MRKIAIEAIEEMRTTAAEAVKETGKAAEQPK
jgi:hypothetical protein